MKVVGQAALLILLASAYGPSGAFCDGMCSCNWERDPLKARDRAAVVVEGLALDSTLSAPPIRGANGHQLFLYRDAPSGLSATMCSLSQPFSEAESVIRKLGPPLRRGAA